MSFDVSNNVNSALVSGLNGLRSASDNITRASADIAQKTIEPRDNTQVLADNAREQITQPGQVPSRLSGADSLTSDLVSLTVNLTNFQASAKVVDTANETVGSLIDTLA